MKPKKLLVVICKDMSEKEMKALDDVLHKTLESIESDVEDLIVTDAEVKVINGSDAKKIFIIQDTTGKEPDKKVLA